MKLILSDNDVQAMRDAVDMAYTSFEGHDDATARRKVKRYARLMRMLSAPNTKYALPIWAGGEGVHYDERSAATKEVTPTPTPAAPTGRTVRIVMSGRTMGSNYACYWLDAVSGFRPHDPDFSENETDEDGHVAGFFYGKQEAATYAREHGWTVVN